MAMVFFIYVPFRAVEGRSRLISSIIPEKGPSIKPESWGEG